VAAGDRESAELAGCIPVAGAHTLSEVVALLSPRPRARERPVAAVARGQPVRAALRARSP
jgi:hypothetical protein